MRVDLLEIKKILYKYFYVNKFEQKVSDDICKLLDLEQLAIKCGDIKTIDLVELIENLDFLYNKKDTNEKVKIILDDFKDYIYSVYNINLNIKAFKYATLPTLKNKKMYKKVDIINNPNIKSINEEMDYDVKLVKIHIETIDGHLIERYVTDWKIKDNESKIIGSFNCSRGTNYLNKKYIIKAQEYSK